MAHIRAHMARSLTKQMDAETTHSFIHSFILLDNEADNALSSEEGPGEGTILLGTRSNPSSASAAMN